MDLTFQNLCTKSEVQKIDATILSSILLFIQILNSIYCRLACVYMCFHTSKRFLFFFPSSHLKFFLFFLLQSVYCFELLLSRFESFLFLHLQLRDVFLNQDIGINVININLVVYYLGTF